MNQKNLSGSLAVTFGRLDPKALGLALASVLGILLFLATVVLLLRGGAVIGPNLSLLAQYFPGYSVTWQGSMIGFMYGALAGFFIGYCFAQVRNSIARLMLLSLRRKAERNAVSDLP